jgi:peptide/nickel transport system permease protein
MEEKQEKAEQSSPLENPGRSLWGDALYRLKKDKLAVMSAVIIVVYFIIAILSGAGVIATRYDDISYRISKPEAIRTIKKMLVGLKKDDAELRNSLSETLAVLKSKGREAALKRLADTQQKLTQVSGREELKIEVEELRKGMDKINDYAAPSWEHLLGTDIQGRDVFHRVIQGTYISLKVALIMSLIYIVIAVFFGSLAGYFGGWVDDLIQWLYQTLASVPGLLLLIALTFVLGQGLTNVAIALGVVGWVGLCRLMRAEYLKHKERDYVLAARALGAGNYRIIFKHILPNTFHIVIISFSLGFVRAIMGEVVLTFVGLGAQAHEPSWGRMISDARAELARDPAVWWPLVGATAAMFVVCLAFNILGDSLRDALDPRLKV